MNGLIFFLFKFSIPILMPKIIQIRKSKKQRGLTFFHYISDSFFGNNRIPHATE